MSDKVECGEQGHQPVADVLKAKHPAAKSAHPSALIEKPDAYPTVPPVVFNQITGSSICQAALQTKGASGLDAHTWRRQCTSFKGASDELCTSLALLARRLCTSFVRPDGIAPFLTCRLIALDKLISKTVLYVTKGDVEDAAGSNQLCAGQLAGIKAAVHEVQHIFSSTETEAILLVDTFNSINRNVALQNVRIICPSLATILINTYRKASKLFMDNQAILSSEGTTQGDPLAMPFYVLDMLPLIDTLKQSCNVHQVWYADDALAAGKFATLKCWWDELCSLSPAFGYFARPGW